MDFNFDKFEGKSDLIDLIIQIEKSKLVKKSQHFHYKN